MTSYFCRDVQTLMVEAVGQSLHTPATSEWRGVCIPQYRSYYLEFPYS